MAIDVWDDNTNSGSLVVVLIQRRIRNAVEQEDKNRKRLEARPGPKRVAGRGARGWRIEAESQPYPGSHHLLRAQAVGVCLQGGVFLHPGWFDPVHQKELIEVNQLKTVQLVARVLGASARQESEGWISIVEDGEVTCYLSPDMNTAASPFSRTFPDAKREK